MGVRMGVLTASLLKALRRPMYFQTVPIIVELVEGSNVAAIAAQVSSMTGIDIRQVLPMSNAFSLIAPTDLVTAIAALDAVDKVHLDRQMFAFEGPGLLPPPPPSPFAMLDIANQKLAALLADKRVFISPDTGWIPTGEANKVTGIYELHNRGFKGQGVKVWVLDTGVDITNPQLQGIVAGAYTTTAGAPNDLNGHGCLTPDAKVLTSYCGVESLGALFERTAAENPPEPTGEGEAAFFKQPVWTIGSVDGHSARSRVKAVYRMKYDGEIIVVKTGPITLKMTPWHKVLVMDHRNRKPKYVRADELTPNNIACVLPDEPVELVENSGCGLGPERTYLIGMFIGDGCIPKSGTEARISMGDSDPTPIEEHLDSLGYNHWREGKKGENQNVDLGIGLKFREFLLSLGFIPGDKTFTVRIPKKIMVEGSKEERAAVLAGIIDSDGHLDRDRQRIRIITASESLSIDIIALCSSLGITARRYSQKPAGKGKHTCHAIHIKAAAMRKLLDIAGRYLKIKRIPKTRNSKRDASHIEISHEHYEGWLYDLTTETENYMVGNNGMMFVHNSWCASRIAGQLYTHPVYGFDLLGGAPECELHTVKVLTDLGFGNTSDIMKAMEMALENEADVVSMSLGGDGGPDEEDDPMVKLINKAAQTHPRTIFVIAAGNSGSQGETAGKTVGIPACAEHALTVGAWSIIDNARSYYSSTGPTQQAGRVKPDIMADGGGRSMESGYKKGVGDIYSGSAFGSQLDPLDFVVDGFCPLKGTSMATPAVASIMALWKQAVPELRTVDIKQIFAKYGKPKNNELGCGLIRATWILDALGT